MTGGKGRAGFVSRAGAGDNGTEKGLREELAEQWARRRAERRRSKTRDREKEEGVLLEKLARGGILD